MNGSYDVAIVGAGIVGLAHAYHLARRGLRVLVLERHPRAAGASVQNFGLIWPIGQPTGPPYQLARRSREIWLELLARTGLWHRKTGSLHLAYAADEAQVLQEFAAAARANGRSAEIWTATEVLSRFSSHVRPEGLQAGLWSPDEVTVDPREVLRVLPDWLGRTYAVEFVFGEAVLGWDGRRVRSSRGEWPARRILICTGSDFRELAPDAFAESDLELCKLQMLRTQPYGPELCLGTVFAAGLSLRHYASFSGCPSLPQLSRRLEAEYADHVRYGIHVLAVQNGSGELVLGDSHEYGDAIEPFDKLKIEDLILSYLRTFTAFPDLRIASRWHGVYATHPSEAFVSRWIDGGALAVTGLGGAGMTLSFGLAEQIAGELSD